MDRDTDMDIDMDIDTDMDMDRYIYICVYIYTNGFLKSVHCPQLPAPRFSSVPSRSCTRRERRMP